MKKENRAYMENNKKQKYTINKTSKFFSFTSILKLTLALAVFLMAALFINAGNVIVENGALNVSNNLLVNTNTLYADSANNRVGIGTTSPSKLLTLKSDSGQLRIETSSDAANYYATLHSPYNSNHPFNLSVANGGVLAEYLGVYADGGANNRVVFPTGNVGIGTTAPTQKLDVAGNIKLSGSIFGSGSTSNYGALTIDGSKNGWSGINFKSGGTNYGTFMVHPDYSGVYNNLDNNWDWYFQNGVLQVGSIPWSLLTSVPAGLSDGDQMGITSESDPTVPAYVKDGTSWGEISGIPAGFADNVDSGGPSNNCRIVYGQIGSRAMCAEDEYMG